MFGNGHLVEMNTLTRWSLVLLLLEIPIDAFDAVAASGGVAAIVGPAIMCAAGKNGNEEDEQNGLFHGVFGVEFDC